MIFPLYRWFSRTFLHVDPARDERARALWMQLQRENWAAHAQRYRS